MKNKNSLFFYKKLFESTPYDNIPIVSNLKKDIFYLPRIVYKKKITTIFVIYSLIRCLFLKKNKFLFFNHSARFIKKTDLSKIPLYLNEQVFDPQHFYYIDDNQEKINTYIGPSSILNSAKINEFVSLAIIPFRMLNKIKKSNIDSKDIFYSYNVKLWILIFKILQPKKILMVVWYGKPWIIEAAKILSIKVIDLQHGILYKEHKFYNLNNFEDKALLKKIIPDQCWVYGEYWKKQLINAGWEEKNLQILGYYLNLPQDSKKYNNARPYILYTTSCSQNKQEILIHINSILSQVKNRNMTIIIAPHPQENPDDYQGILSDLVSLSSKDSYNLLKNCYVHISTFSTLLWEGLYFKKSTYILSYEIHSKSFDILIDLVEKGLARSLSSGQFPEKFHFPNNSNTLEYFSSVTKKSISSI